MMKKAALLVLIPLLQHCGTRPAAQSGDGLDRTPFHHAPTAKNLDGVTISILRSPSLEKRWGKPEIAVTPEGGYHLSYRKPGDHFEGLDIYALPGSLDSDAPNPPDIIHYETRSPQKWRNYFIAGIVVHAFVETPGGGDTPATVSTVTFPVSLSGKPTASYRIVATSNNGEDSKEIRTYLTSASF